MLTRRALTLVFGSVLLAAGCRKAKPETTPAPAATPAQPAASPAGGAAPAPGTSAPASSGADAAAISAAMATLTSSVYFEYDQDALSAEAQANLDQKLGILVANPNVGIRVTGHADERGSDEYNLALGQRRASTIKRYLTDRGIAESRVSVVSMGEERPACSASEEECWRRNRRAEVEVTAGAITKVAR